MRFVAPGRFTLLGRVLIRASPLARGTAPR
jgi:hypothetical protein